MLAATGALSVTLVACGGTAPSTGETGADPAATAVTGETSVTGGETGGEAGGGTAGETATMDTGSMADETAMTTDDMADETTTTTDGMADETATTTSGSATSSTGDASGSAASEMDPLAALEADGRFTTLVTAIRAAGLEQQLSQLPAFTLFAPTDEAFLALPANQLQDLLANPQQLADILLFHIADEKLLASEVTAATSVETLAGEPLSISASGGNVLLNSSAEVVDTDMEVGNGVIHVIDQVLIPSS
jgi:uncharacterized surface protein with fasciclin (FAS1) repeats